MICCLRDDKFFSMTDPYCFSVSSMSHLRGREKKKKQFLVCVFKTVYTDTQTDTYIKSYS